MRQLPKRTAILIGAAVFAAVTALSWYLGTPDSEEAAVVVEAAPRTATQPEAAAADQVPPGLALSRSPRMAQREAQTPLFAVRSWAPPPPPPPPAPPPAPPPPPTPPALPFALLGMLVDDAGRPTYYLTQGEKAYSVTDGEVIESKYRVKGISGSQLVLTYLPMRADQSLAVPPGIVGVAPARPSPPPSAAPAKAARAPAGGGVPSQPTMGMPGRPASSPQAAASAEANAPGSGLPAVLVWQGPVDARQAEEIALGLWARARQPLASLGLSLSFDPARLTVVRVEQGELIKGTQVVFAPRVDPTAGRVEINVATRGETAITGEGDLIRLVVAPKSPGAASSIGVSSALARTSDGRTERLPNPQPHQIGLRP